MKSSVIKKHSTIIAGHKTSISLEDEFWTSLREIAGEHGKPLSNLLGRIDAERHSAANLSSAIRLFILRHYRNQLDQQDEIVASLGSTKANGGKDFSNSIEVR
jgi:predicted DNA-binding ribbon-helix-helix protein